MLEDFTAQLWEWKGWIVEHMARPGAVQQLAGSSYLAAASLTRAPTAAGVKKRQNLQHPENYNRNTIPKHKRQMFDRRSIVAYWYPRAVPLRWNFFSVFFYYLSLKYIPTIGGGAVPEGAKKKPFQHLKGCLDLLSSKQKMVIWVLFTHIKNIFNGSIMTSPRPKYGEALVAGGLAYSSDVILYYI